MRYWLTAIVAAALTIAGGWFVLLNQAEVLVRVAPERFVAAPLGATLLAAFLGGAGVVALLATGGAVARPRRGARWRAAAPRPPRRPRRARSRDHGARRRARVDGRDVGGTCRAAAGPGTSG